MQPKNNQPTNQFANLTEEDLRRLFLEASVGPRENGNRFFNNFKYQSDLFSGNWSSSLNGGLDLLNRCHHIDPDAFARIHKGSAYYWLGLAAYLVGDYESCLFFMDSTVSEDARAGLKPSDADPSPGFLFALLDDDSPRQAGRNLVSDARARMEESIHVYNERPDRPKVGSELSVSLLREKFLVKAILPGGEEWRSLATALISFRLEWDYLNLLFDIRPAQGTAEPFFLHLFKGCVLFESLLRHNPTITTARRKTTLEQLVSHLNKKLNIKIPKLTGQLPAILSSLEPPDSSIQKAIETTGKLRNALGHDLGWTSDLQKIQYQNLFQMVISSCLHTIVCLY